MPPPYRAAIFDLDGTLVSEHVGVDRARAAVAAALRSTGHSVTDDAYSQAAQQALDEVIAKNGGEWPVAFPRQKAIARALHLLGFPEDIAAPLEPVYRDARLQHLTLIPGAREVLETIRAELPLGLITNGRGEQREKLRRCDIAGYFQAVVISEEAGISKPDSQIFQTALTALGLPTSAVVYIGNNYMSDVEGAGAAGIDAIWFNANGDPPPENAMHDPIATLRTLTELPGLILESARRESAGR